MSDFPQSAGKDRKQTAIGLASYLMHKHYCENDVESVIEYLDESFTWIGTGEYEYAAGRERASALFRELAETVPRCRISEEYYDARQIAPEVYICNGHLGLVPAHPEDDCRRIHQRITMLFRWEEDKVYCSHIHIPNPHAKTAQGEAEPAETAARQSYASLQERIEEQKKTISVQMTELASIYNTIPCVITRMLRTKEGYRLLTFNRALTNLLGKGEEEIRAMDWSEGFCSEIAEEDIPLVQRSLQSLQKPGDFSAVDYRVRNSMGTWSYMSGNHLLVNESEEGQIVQKIAYDITERVKLERNLKQKSYEDSLTGLFNRSKFDQEMENYLEQEKPLGVAYFDINGLKAVNDRSGHGAGDDLLRRVAKHLDRNFKRKTYRIGGDEFIIVDDGRNENEFRELIGQVCREMRQDGIQISVGCSWRPSCASLKEQFDEADRLMYLDKKRFYSDKRNGCCKRENI